MSRLRNYFLTALGIFIVFNWLLGLPHFLLGVNSSVGTLQKIDLRDFAEVRKHVSQGYGGSLFALLEYVGGTHNGIDISAKVGAPVLSPATGTVLFAGNEDDYCRYRGLGKFIAVYDAAKDDVLLYAHLQKSAASINDKIGRGELVGYVGTTGKTTAPHLHLSVYTGASFKIGKNYDCGPGPRGATINPVSYFD